MKRSLLLIVAMAIVMTVVSFVGCNSEIPDDVGKVSVSFAPSVPKSLNQDGKAQEVNAKVGDFKWKYYVSQQAITLSDDLEWKTFYDDFDTTSPTNGLGTIKNLDKNQSYYFALRAYSTGTDSLLEWEGKTEGATRLSARNTTVTITVNPVGLGSIYFNFTAPVFSDWNLITSGLNTISSPTDKFVISWTAMSDKNTSGTNTYDAVLNEDADEFAVNTVNEKEPLLLKAGTYLFTVKQQTYNEDINDFEDVSGRKQILIVDAQSGVDTVIAGSLDSTSYQVFNYEAGAATDQYGLEIEMIQDDGNINNLVVIAKNSDGVAKYIRQYDRVYVYHNAYLILDFSSSTDAYDIYVNGSKILTNTDLTSDSDLPGLQFYKKTSTGDDGQYYTDCSYLNTLNDSNRTIRAYGKENVDYLVTIVCGSKSKTFTIVGRNDQLNTGKAEGIYTEQELKDLGSNYITINYTHNFKDPNDIDIVSGIKASSALQILQDNLPANATDASKNYLTLTLSVIEKEITLVNAHYDISLSALIECKDSSGNPFYSKFENVTSVTDYVTISVSTAPKLTEVRMFHSDVEMTSTTDLEGASSTVPDHPGFFNYTDYSMYGQLGIKTRTFSPFTSTYIMAETHTVKFMVKDGAGYHEFSRQTVEHNGLASKPWVRNANASYDWYKDKDLEEDWDFVFDTVTQDIELYGKKNETAPAEEKVFIKYNKDSLSGWSDYQAIYSGTTWLEMINYQSNNNLKTLGNWGADAKGYVVARYDGEIGYLFDNDGQKVKVSDYVVTNNNNQDYRYWLRTVFQLSFKVNNARSTEVFAPITVIDGYIVGLLPTVSGDFRPKHFDGWYYNSSKPFGDQVISTTVANKWNSRTLYGRWTGPKVIFMDYNDSGILKQIYVDDYGDTIGDEFVSNPTFKGETYEGGPSYAFRGWIDYSSRYWDSNTPVTEDLTVLRQSWKMDTRAVGVYDFTTSDTDTHEVSVCFVTKDQLKKVYGKYKEYGQQNFSGHGQQGNTRPLGKFYIDEGVWDKNNTDFKYGNDIDYLDERGDYFSAINSFIGAGFTISNADCLIAGTGVGVPDCYYDWGDAVYWIEYVTETDLGNKVYPVLANSVSESAEWPYIIVPDDKTFTGVTILNLTAPWSTAVLTPTTDRAHAVRIPSWNGSFVNVFKFFATYEINATLVTYTLDKTSPTDNSLRTQTQQTVKVNSGPIHGQINQYLKKPEKEGYNSDWEQHYRLFWIKYYYWFTNPEMTSRFYYDEQEGWLQGCGNTNRHDFTIYSRYLPEYSIEYVMSGKFTYNDNEKDFGVEVDNGTTLETKYAYLKGLNLSTSVHRTDDNYSFAPYYDSSYYYQKIECVGWSEDGFKQFGVEESCPDSSYITSIPASSYGNKKLYSVWNLDAMRMY